MSVEPSLYVPNERFCASVLNHLGIPVLLVERDATVRYANAAANVLLSSGWLNKAVDDTLSTPQGQDNQRLRDAIVDACSEGTERVLVIGGERQAPRLVLLARPFNEGISALRRRTLILVRGGINLTEDLVNALRQLFRLSPAEASIAVALGTGSDLNELAVQRRVKLNTLRSQVASIMAKTGTRRQAQLVALVVRIESLF